MPTLLTLPQEIRDRIIHLVIIAQRSAPKDHLSDNRPRAGTTDIVYQYPILARYVRNEVESLLPSTSGLLGASRQLRKETLAALEHARRSPPGLQFVVDVMFVDELELWPTWLAVPLATRHLDTVDVMFRVVSHLPEYQSGNVEHYHHLWGASPGEIPALDWLLYGLVERFLQAGPVGARPQGPPIKTHNRGLVGIDACGDVMPLRDAVTHEIVDRVITVKHLIVNVNSCVDGSLLAAPEQHDEWLESRQRDIDSSPLRCKIMRPEWFEAYLANRLSYLLSVNYNSFDWGNFLYERVGRITFRVDGTITREFDLGVMLAVATCDRVDTTSLTSSLEDRITEFKAWKMEAMRLREEADLHVVPLVHED